MAEPIESKKRSVDLPWATIVVAILATTGGFFLYLNPLQTSRPTERAGFQLNLDRPQDVDARLWEDPLRTATEHEARVILRPKDSPEFKQENERHDPAHFWDQKKPSESWVLAVMIPGGSYAEYTEIRLRTRQAVLEALGAANYVPADVEHIGYVKIDKVAADRGWNWRSMIVPFEWCDHKARDQRDSSSAELPDHVCVLWLREEEFQTDPMQRLNWLLRDPERCFDKDTSKMKIRIIGPLTSTTLRAMVEEVASFSERQPILADVEMWSPTATASDALLLHGVDKVSGFSDVETLLETKLGGDGQPFLFRRATVTDREVIRTLLHELRRNRGLNFERKDANQRKLDRIVLISEWDTFYGRALPITLEYEACRTDIDIDQLLAGNHPDNFLVFHYLRGIDGMLPGPPTSTDGKPKEETKQSSVAREITEGLNQADYLRRLARELADLNADFLRKGESGIAAVGVLGSDVYDKLLVLEALRSALPNAIFFTSSIDARLAHPDEWRWARNLLVASPFGLTINDAHKNKIPPFRDSNQTACYIATLFAAGDKVRDHFVKNAQVLRPPRLYEVGRNGAFDLTIVPEGIDTLQPASADIQHWWNWPRSLLTVGIISLIICGIVWALSVIVGGRPHLGEKELWYQQQNPLPDRPPESVRARQQARTGASYRLRSTWVWLHWQLFRRNRSVTRVLLSSWSMFAISAIVSIVVVWAICQLGGPNGEPYSWNDGISVWPTETLRLLAFLLSIFYILKTWRALHRNQHQIEFQFRLFQRRESPEKHPRFSKLWWHQLVQELTVRHWKCEENQRVIAIKLWSRYLHAIALKACLWRITPLILCYVGAGILLMSLLGWPSVPARGSWARNWNYVFFSLAMVGSMFLTFYVADATLLNRRLIHYLTKSATLWPEDAFTGIRARWRLREQVAPAESTPPGEIPPTELLIDYLDIDLIARRTEVVGGLIYYPFIAISLLILSGTSVFDHWTWSLPLSILVAFNSGYAAFSAIYLRRTAERARQSALQRLTDLLIAYTAAGHGDEKEAKTIGQTTSLIRAENRGAFAGILQHPLARALLLPSGSAGIWALFQYFPRWFT